MNITLIVIVFVLLLICFNELLNITRLDIGRPEKLLRTSAVVIGFLVFFHVFYILYIYFDLLKYRGQTGPKGIPGLRGKNGNPGECNTSCGKGLCYKNCIEKINKTLREKGIEEKFNNTFLATKINDLIQSEKYENAVNLSNEKEIIDYVVSTVDKWIILISSIPKKGKEFLTTEKAQPSMFDFLNPDDKDAEYDNGNKEQNPFNEIKKYEIWSWANGYTFKPIVRRQCNSINEMPGTLPAPVNLVFSNNYVKDLSLIAIPPKNKWGPDNEELCPFGQLGADYSNPRNIEFCYKYTENTQNIKMEPVWKKVEYTDFKLPISFFNLNSIKTNRTFYPVGTVWRPKDSLNRDNFSDDIGPNKKTILVSGANVKKIENYNLIWPRNDSLGSKLGFFVWRGYFNDDDYVSLGDIVTNTRQEPEEFYGISKKCLEEVDLVNEPIWTTKGYSMKEKPSIKSKVKETELKRHLSIWPIGMQDKTEEKKEFSSTKLNKYLGIGYNLFRANSSIDKKPDIKGYTIKSKCTLQIESKDKDTPSDELGVGWYSLDKESQRKNEQSAFTKLGFTPTGIITNKEGETVQKLFIDFIQVVDTEDKYYAIRTQDGKDTKYFNDKGQPKILSNVLDKNDTVKNDFKWDLQKVDNDKVRLVSFNNSNNIFKNKNWDFFPSTGFE